MIQWIALAVLLSPGAQQPHKTLLEQVVPNPTGTNGYEDYLRAAELLRGPDFGNYINWSPDRYEELVEQLKAHDAEPPPGGVALREFPDVKAQLANYKRMDSMTKLQVWKEGVEKFSKALDFLAAGNRKRVTDPHERLDMLTLFPEYAYFKSLAKLADMAAYVAFAEGRSKQGTQILLDSYQLGFNLEGKILIAHLVGTAIESISLAGFERHLDSISRQDAALIESAVPGLLEGEPRVIGCIQNEQKFSMVSLTDILNGKYDLTGQTSAGGEEESPEGKSLREQIKRLSGSQIQALVGRASTEIDHKLKPIIARFRGPESGWVVNAPPPGNVEEEVRQPSTVQELMDNFIEDSTSVFDQVGLSAAKSRTQLRLLGLSAAVIRYKWDTGNLPDSLAAAVKKSLISDPLSGQDFAYERLGFFSFRIVSRGVPQTGEIGLKWRRAPGSNQGDPNPPPLDSPLTLVGDPAEGK
jgi:hypothetical protein